MISVEKQRELLAKIRKEPEIKKWLNVCKWLNIASIIVGVLFFVVALILAAARPIETSEESSATVMYLVNVYDYAALLFFYFLIPIAAAVIVSKVLFKKTQNKINERLQTVIAEEMAKEEREAAGIPADAFSEFFVAGADFTELQRASAPPAPASPELKGYATAPEEEAKMRRKVVVVKKYLLFCIIGYAAAIVASLLMLIPSIDFLGESIFTPKLDIGELKYIFTKKADGYAFVFSVAIGDFHAVDGEHWATAMNIVAFSIMNLFLMIVMPIITIVEIIRSSLRYAGAEERLRNGPKRAFKVDLNGNSANVPRGTAFVVWQIVGMLIIAAVYGYAHFYYLWKFKEAGCGLNYFVWVLPAILLLISFGIMIGTAVYYKKNEEILYNYNLSFSKKVNV